MIGSRGAAVRAAVLLFLSILWPQQTQAVSYYYVVGTAASPNSPEEVIANPAQFCTAIINYYFNPPKEHKLTAYDASPSPWLYGCFYCQTSGPNCTLYDVKPEGSSPCIGCNTSHHQWRKQAPCEYQLTFGGNGTIEAGEVHPVTATLNCGGAGGGVPMRFDTAVQAHEPAAPAGQLRKKAGEAATCSATGTSISCTTDADRTINLEFVASSTSVSFDAVHNLTAHCTDVTKPCVPSVGSATVTVRANPATLGLQAGGEIRAGNYLFGQRVTLTRDGQPAAGVEVEIRVQPGAPGIPTAALQKAQGEAATCGSGEVVSCVTDADGIIDFTFYVPGPDLGFNTSYSISARCTDAGTLCTPEEVGPSLVTVTGCPAVLSLSAEGEVVPVPAPRQDAANGLFAEVTKCGEPASGVAVQITSWPEDMSQPQATLQPEGGSLSQCVAGAMMDCTTDATGRIEFSFVPGKPRPTVDKLHHITALCPDPAEPCTPEIAGPEAMTVRGCPITLMLEGGAAEVEPLGYLPGFYAEARDCLEALVEDVGLSLESKVMTRSGYHDHGEDDGAGYDPDRPRGKIDATCVTEPSGCPPGSAANSEIVGLTGEDGRFHFDFFAPAPAGIHDISVQCLGDDTGCGDVQRKSVEVKVEGLSLISNGYFTYVGDKPQHPLNHYLKKEARDRLSNMAQLLHEIFAQDDQGNANCLEVDKVNCSLPRIRVNDASLPWGGLFDIDCRPGSGNENTDGCMKRAQTWWQPPHGEHRCGIAVDIKSDARLREVFQRMRLNWDDYVNNEGGHYHLWLRGIARKESGGLKCSDLQ